MFKYIKKLKADRRKKRIIKMYATWMSGFLKNPNADPSNLRRFICDISDIFTEIEVALDKEKCDQP